MLTEENEQILLEKAQEAENMSDWTNSLKFYNEAVKLFQSKNKLEAIAPLYRKLGYINSEIARTVDTAEEKERYNDVIIGHLKRAKELFAQSNNRIGVWQGGTRSSKTYNIVLGWIILLSQQENMILTVCRETMVSIKNTVYRDFIEILDKVGLYDEKYHSKGDMTYMLGSNLIEFRGLDDDQKIRGAKRDYL